MKLADIQPFEQLIVTKIIGNNWCNRVYSFAILGEDDSVVEARGSLSHFLNKDERVCIIVKGLIDPEGLQLYFTNKLPIIDIGFNPLVDHKNEISNAKIFLEFFKEKQEVEEVSHAILLLRKRFKRIILSSLITGLKVTETHTNCLQGSAEFPEIIMKEAGLVKYQGIFVHNITRGGTSAETYCVPTPPGVVRTTGAMAKLVKKDEKAAISSYEITTQIGKPVILIVRNNVIDLKIEL